MMIKRALATLAVTTAVLAGGSAFTAPAHADTDLVHSRWDIEILNNSPIANGDNSQWGIGGTVDTSLNGFDLALIEGVR